MLIGFMFIQKNIIVVLFLSLQPTDPCMEGTLWCKETTECIDAMFICDGFPHCPFPADELGCGNWRNS